MRQARRLLQDLARFRAALEERSGRPVPEPVAAYRWLREVYEPTTEFLALRFLVHSCSPYAD